MNARLQRVLAALVALAAAGLAQAGPPAPATPAPPAFREECGACHIAFHPGLLPAASWQSLMGKLARHYGTDASLDAVAARDIAAYLQANAGTGKRAREQPPEDRITRSAWFLREHDEVPADAWKRPSVKGPSNCAACHPAADKGDFNERAIRIPR